LPEENEGEVIKENKKICLFLGRLHPIKGLENLIHAWARLSQHIDGWQLSLVGPGNDGYKKKLENLVHKLNVADTVIFAGPQYGQEKAKWFKSSEFFISPSQSEGMPIAILEAMSYGLPVLLTDACNFHDAKEHSAGIQVGTSVDDLKEGMLNMMTMSDGERQLMGTRGYQCIKRKYQWESIADHLLDVYIWMLGLSDAPSSVVFT